MTYDKLPINYLKEIIRSCIKNGITRPDDIRIAYNNYIEGRNIFDGLPESYQRASAFGKFLANGGHIYSGEEEETLQMQTTKPNIFMRPDGSYFYLKDSKSPEVSIEPLNRLSEDPALWTYIDDNGNRYTPHVMPTNQSLVSETPISNGPISNAIRNYFSELQYRASTDPSSIAIQGKYTLPAIAAISMLPAMGTILTNPFVDAALTSAGGAHAIQSLANGEADWMTAMELAPMARLARPIYNATTELSGPLIDAIQQNIELGRNTAGEWNGWVRLGNREYRPPRTSLGVNHIIPESRPVRVEGFDGISVPDGFTPVRVQKLNTRNGTRTVHLVKDNSTGKTKVLEDMQFKSELDWSPKNWYESAGRKYKSGKNAYNDKDIADLESHIPEYIEIERKAKQNGTWLRMPDGSTWQGDPRDWVIIQSKAVQDLNPEVFYTGIHKEINPYYNEQLWGLPVLGQSKLASAVARTYSHDDMHVVPMITKRFEGSDLATIDAGGNEWRFIRNPKTGEIRSTDDIVNSNAKKKVIKINNVVDRGDITKSVPLDSKYYYEGIAMDESVPQNNIVLNPGTFRKAIHGSNGNFRHPTHIYRGIIPAVFTTGLGYSIFNKSH